MSSVRRSMFDVQYWPAEQRVPGRGHYLPVDGQHLPDLVHELELGVGDDQFGALADPGP